MQRSRRSKFQRYHWAGVFTDPQEAVRDVLRIYVLVIPVLGIASFWEFLSPWNR